MRSRCGSFHAIEPELSIRMRMSWSTFRTSASWTCGTNRNEIVELPRSPWNDKVPGLAHGHGEGRVVEREGREGRPDLFERRDRLLRGPPLRVALSCGDGREDGDLNEDEDDQQAEDRGDGRRHALGIPNVATHGRAPHD